MLLLLPLCCYSVLEESICSLNSDNIACFSCSPHRIQYILNDIGDTPPQAAILIILTYIFLRLQYNYNMSPFPVSPSNPLLYSSPLSFKFLAFFQYSLFNAYMHTHICCSIHSLILYKLTRLHVQVWSFDTENTSQVFSFLLFSLVLFVRLRHEGLSPFTLACPLVLSLVLLLSQFCT